MKSLKKGGKTVQWLRENVRFEQSGSMVFCDEAEYDPATEDLVGRGNVRITNPDGATVTGKTLEYNNATNHCDGTYHKDAVLRTKQIHTKCHMPGCGRMFLIAAEHRLDPHHVTAAAAFAALAADL